MPRRVGSAVTYLCGLKDLTEGTAKGFDPWHEGWSSVFAFLHGGVVRVFRNRCPHLNVRMEYRTDGFMSADGQRVICYAHGAHFLPDTGLCVHGPCLGKSLTKLSCYVDSFGRVQLDQYNESPEMRSQDQ